MGQNKAMPFIVQSETWNGRRAAVDAAVYGRIPQGAYAEYPCRRQIEERERERERRGSAAVALSSWVEIPHSRPWAE
jgi:hypothetical protein